MKSVAVDEMKLLAAIPILGMFVPSGKFMVRVPPEGHRMLSIQAAESGVSLNRLVASKLAKTEGYRRAEAG